MQKISTSEILCISNDYIIHTLDAHKKLFWLLNIKTGLCYTMNETAHLILCNIDGKTTTTKILETVISKYSIENAREVTNNFKEFIDSMIKQKVLYTITT